MTDTMITAVLAPSVAAVITGLGYLGKRYIDAIERKRNEALKDRDAARQKIIDEIETLKKELEDLKKDYTYLQCQLLECDNPGCSAKKRWAEYLCRKMKIANNDNKNDD